VRIGLAVVLALSLLIAPLVADTQETGKVSRIGFLSAASPSTISARVEAFRQGLPS
jgi:hypothetical protein